MESMTNMNIKLHHGTTVGLLESGLFYALDVREASADKISIALQKVFAA